MSSNLLENRDYIIIVARSAASCDPKHPWYEHWLEAQAALVDLIKKCQQLDSDGLTVYEASHPLQRYDGTTVAKFAEILQQQNQQSREIARGHSNLYEALHEAFHDYFQRKIEGKEKKGLIIVVVLDSKQDESASLSNLIIEATNQLDRDEEIGISFIQIGDEAITREFLTSLDDDLQQKGAKFDIVDTKYWHEIPRKSISQFLIEAIHD